MGVAHLSCWIVRSKSETKSLLVSSNCSWGLWTCIPLWLHLCPLHLFIVKLLEGKVPWLTLPYVVFSLSHCTMACFLFTSLKLHWPTSVIAKYWGFSPYLYSLCRIWLRISGRGRMSIKQNFQLLLWTKNLISKNWFSLKSLPGR